MLVILFSFPDVPVQPKPFIALDITSGPSSNSVLGNKVLKLIGTAGSPMLLKFVTAVRA